MSETSDAAPGSTQGILSPEAAQEREAANESPVPPRVIPSPEAAQEREAANESLVSRVQQFARACTRNHPLIEKKALVVVASLIAAATFQAALSPPSTITDDKVTNPNINCNFWHFASDRYGDKFRKCRTYRITFFIVYNTLSFVSSVMLLFFSHRPNIANMLLETSAVCLLSTYAYLLVGISPNHATDVFLMGSQIIAGLVLLLRMILKMFLFKFRRGRHE